MDQFLNNFINIIKGNAAGTNVYHGTLNENVPRIQKEGFQKSQYGWIGKGVYASHKQA